MMYERFARVLSESLFNSVYTEMQKIAEKEQEGIYARLKKREKMYAGEAQETFNAFCHNKLSLGHALDFLNVRKAYQTAR